MLPSESVILPPAFKLASLEMRMRARTCLSFLDWRAGNYFRGQFGITARGLCCPANCPGAATCELRKDCHYANLFEPVPLVAGPSGFANLPRPFVLRTEELNGKTFQPGDVFQIRMHLFGNNQALPLIELTFRNLERMELLEMKVVPVSIELTPQACSSVTLQFLTPTEIKWKEKILHEPQFPALISRIRDRIAALSTFYGDGAPDWDYKNLADKSEAIRLVNNNVEMAYAERRSSRTGQRHGLGGFVGLATYEGDLANFIQLLRVAEWTGVGRHTPWGNGAIRLEVNDNLQLIASVKLNKSEIPGGLNC